VSEVEIRIDVISLEGFGRLDAARLQLGIESELGRLLRERGVPASWSSDRSLRALDGGSFTWQGRGPADLVSGIAASLYEELAQ
jgi:arginine utilization protein RocB